MVALQSRRTWDRMRVWFISLMEAIDRWANSGSLRGWGWNSWFELHSGEILTPQAMAKNMRRWQKERWHHRLLIWTNRRQLWPLTSYRSNKRNRYNRHQKCNWNNRHQRSNGGKYNSLRSPKKPSNYWNTWCNRHNLIVNPSKTSFVIPFTRCIPTEQPTGIIINWLVTHGKSSPKRWNGSTRLSFRESSMPCYYNSIKQRIVIIWEWAV